MRKINTLTKAMAALATLGLCFPPVALSSTSASAESPRVVDVALLDGGVLVGQVVNASGTGVAELPVALQQQNKTVVTLKTNKQGYFAVKGVQAGTYRLATSDAQGVCRLWAPKTAPPTAQRGALLVTADPVARAQYGPGIRNMLANPWIVAGIVACAVAIPVALHNADHDTPSSS